MAEELFHKSGGAKGVKLDLDQQSLRGASRQPSISAAKHSGRGEHLDFMATGGGGHPMPMRTQSHQDLVEMQVHIPKIKISKYFKTKYQGAVILPS